MVMSFVNALQMIFVSSFRLPWHLLPLNPGLHVHWPDDGLQKLPFVLPSILQSQSEKIKLFVLSFTYNKEGMRFDFVFRLLTSENH